MQVDPSSVIKEVKRIETELRYECGYNYVEVDTYMIDGTEVSPKKYWSLMEKVFDKYADDINDALMYILGKTCDVLGVVITCWGSINKVLSHDAVNVIDAVYTGVLWSEFDESMKSVIKDVISRYSKQVAIDIEYNESLGELGVGIMPNVPWNAFMRVALPFGQEELYYDDYVVAMQTPPVYAVIEILNKKIKPKPECMSDQPPMDCVG